MWLVTTQIGNDKDSEEITILTLLYCKEGEKNMKGNNTPETLQKFAENLLAELDQTVDCAVWDCSECPLDLKETEEYSCHGKHNCGWLLLEEATLKLLRK